MRSLILIPGLGSDGVVWRRIIVALGSKVDRPWADTLSDDTLANMGAPHPRPGSRELRSLASPIPAEGWRWS